MRQQRMDDSKLVATNALCIKVHAASVFLHESCYICAIGKASAILCHRQRSGLLTKGGREGRWEMMACSRLAKEKTHEITISTQRCWMARISSTKPSCCLLGCLGEMVFQESSQMLVPCTARQQTERKVCSHTYRIACTLPWRTFSLSLNPTVSLLVPILNEACFTACKFPAFKDLFAIWCAGWTVCNFISRRIHKRTRVATHKLHSSFVGKSARNILAVCTTEAFLIHSYVGVEEEGCRWLV